MQSEVFIADTHALVWYFVRDRKLSQAGQKSLRDVEHGDLNLVVPTIVLAEMQTLAERKMPNIPMSAIVALFESRPNITIAPFDFAHFKEFASLPSSLEMHDRIIAA